MSRNSVDSPEYCQNPVLKVSKQLTETLDLSNNTLFVQKSANKQIFILKKIFLLINRESFKSPLMPFGKCIEYIECFKDALNKMFISLFSDLTMKNL